MLPTRDTPQIKNPTQAESEGLGGKKSKQTDMKKEKP